jgi:hypothetical protein
VKTLLLENQDEFEIIGEAVGTLVSAGIDLARIFVSVIAPAFRTIVIPALRATIDLLDFMIDKLARAIEFSQAVSAGNIDEAGDIALEAGGQQAEFERFQQSLATQGRQEAFSERIEVIVEGDTDVVRDVSTQVVKEESQAARRNTGTPSGVR